MSRADRAEAAGSLRLGMVGTDILHAQQYAGLFNVERGDHPALPQLVHDLEAQSGGEPLRRGHTPEDATSPTTANQTHDGPLGCGRVTHWWAPERAEAERQAADTGVDTVTDTLEELAEAVDVGLVCTWSGATHAELALPFLARGKPVYIDKPLCEEPADARALRETAEANDTFFFSSSPWKWAPAVQTLLSDLPSIGDVRTVVVSGPAVHGSFFYVTHSVELLQRLLGPGAVTVRAESDELRHLMTIQYASGVVGVINGLRGTRWIRHAVVYGADGYVEVDISHRQRDEGMVAMLTAFMRGVLDGRPPLPMSWGEEVVRILDGGHRSVSADGEPWRVDGMTAPPG